MRKVAIAVGAFALFAVAPVSANGKVDYTACNQECQKYCQGNSGGLKRQLVCQNQCVRKCHEDRGEAAILGRVPM
jgi:hypothetical protein